MKSPFFFSIQKAPQINLNIPHSKMGYRVGWTERELGIKMGIIIKPTHFKKANSKYLQFCEIILQAR
jgi:hypothetical protein